MKATFLFDKDELMQFAAKVQKMMHGETADYYQRLYDYLDGVDAEEELRITFGKSEKLAVVKNTAFSLILQAFACDKNFKKL